MMKKQGLDLTGVKSPTYNLSWDNMVRLKNEAYDEAVGTAMTLLLSIPVKVVVERYNWEQEDVERFCEDILDEYEKFDAGDMTLEDLQHYVFEHCGVKFERK